MKCITVESLHYDCTHQTVPVRRGSGNVDSNTIEIPVTIIHARAFLTCGSAVSVGCPENVTA